MGVIGAMLGKPGAAAALGAAAADVAEVFQPNATKAMELSAAAQAAALAQMEAEYGVAGTSWFDRLVNGLNRLPRPLLAFGTLGLFTYAMVNPESFATRMVGLNMVPEPLWWLLGAIVAFYFGARESHYFRVRPLPGPAEPGREPELGPAGSISENAALQDWLAGR